MPVPWVRSAGVKVPEAPELEVAKDFLNQRATGVTVLSGSVLRPSVLRLIVADLPSDIGGRTIEQVQRKGKWLVVSLSGDRQLIVNPMLTGAFQYCPPTRRRFKRTAIVLELANGMELRYVDDRQMGRVYYTSSAHVS